MSLNKMCLIGNLGKDPEIKTMPNGNEVASFSIATSETWKDKNTGEKKEKTEWHKIVVFGALVGIVKSYVKKGNKLYIEGSLKTREYDKDGEKRYITEIVLQGFNSVLQILDGKKSQEREEVSYAESEGVFVDTINEDIIPY